MNVDWDNILTQYMNETENVKKYVNETENYMNGTKTGKGKVFRVAFTHTSKGIFFLGFFLKVYFAWHGNSAGKTFFWSTLIGFPFFFEIDCVVLETGLHWGLGCVKRKQGLCHHHDHHHRCHHHPFGHHHLDI